MLNKSIRKNPFATSHLPLKPNLPKANKDTLYHLISDVFTSSSQYIYIIITLTYDLEYWLNIDTTIPSHIAMTLIYGP